MPDSCGGGFNGLNQKEFSKPPVGKREKRQQMEARRNAAREKAARRAREEEEEEARLRSERDPAEKEAELASSQEAERNKADVRRLQNAQKKAAKACSSNDWVYALSLYTECIDIDGEDHLHWSNRAAVQGKLGRYEEMLEDAARCVELCPGFAKGWARLGAANAALERYDAAEEAFRRALALEPESTASLEGLAAAQRAREEAALHDEDPFDAMLRELKLLTVPELRERALGEGVRGDRVEQAEADEDAKEALVSLITAHRYIVDLAHEDLAEMDSAGLRARALAEGLDEEDVSAAAGGDDPVGALKALIVEFLSADLIGAATEILAEAQFEEVSDEDAEAVGDDLDFEIVALDDESELDTLGANDVFLAGAYIDQTYGELVLPNGIRLGHRSMHKYYRQRLRPQDDKQVVLAGARQKAMSLHSRVAAKMACRREWRTENHIAGAALGAARGASDSTAARKWRMELHNMKVWHNLHMWGGGGGGSHYWGAGSKQYNKGAKVKGVVLRHSRQGARMQAARNKASRGDASHAVLR